MSVTDASLWQCGSSLEAVPDLSARGGRQLKLATKQQVEQEIEQASKLGAAFICYGDDDYPPSLLQFDDAPFVLTVKGHKSVLAAKGCALVGAETPQLMQRGWRNLLPQKSVRPVTP